MDSEEPFIFFLFRFDTKLKWQVVAPLSKHEKRQRKQLLQAASVCAISPPLSVYRIRMRSCFGLPLPLLTDPNRHFLKGGVSADALADPFSARCPMQNSIDELRRAVMGVPEYAQHTKDAEPDTHCAILPLCTIRSSLLIHPVIVRHSLDATKVYHAMLKLLEVHDDEESADPTYPYGARFACTLCGVQSAFVPENNTVNCPVCGMSQAGYISYDAPYREFADTETRAHWTESSNGPNENRWATIHQFSACFPKLGSSDLEKAAQCVNTLSNRESIRNLNIVTAASMLLADNPDILTNRQIRIAEPEKPSHGCQMCGRAHFDNKTARYCCGNSGIYRATGGCEREGKKSRVREGDNLVVEVSRCKFFA